jgi:pantoate--beta-alanine ligase
MPDVICEIPALRARLNEVRRGGASIGFVPTMGALHAGHGALLEAARRETEFVVASIFVNPLQFDRNDDLKTYPRTMEGDLRLCEEHGTHLIFAPTPQELYPEEQVTFVDSPSLSTHLCGAHRPGHFRGVATVVLKLFNIVQPDRAYFGRKDAQQLAMIERMVRDLNVPVTVVPVETVREADGLALSSRNKHLTAAEREIAPVLALALNSALDRIQRGERSVAAVREQVLPLFAPYPEVHVEYFEVTDSRSLIPVASIDGPVLIAGAIWLGSTRLIDNVAWPGKKEDLTSCSGSYYEERFTAQR